MRSEALPTKPRSERSEAKRLGVPPPPTGKSNSWDQTLKTQKQRRQPRSSSPHRWLYRKAIYHCPPGPFAPGFQPSGATKNDVRPGNDWSRRSRRGWVARQAHGRHPAGPVQRCRRDGCQDSKGIRVPCGWRGSSTCRLQEVPLRREPGQSQHGMAGSRSGGGGLTCARSLKCATANHSPRHHDPAWRFSQAGSSQDNEVAKKRERRSWSLHLFGHHARLCSEMMKRDRECSPCAPERGVKRAKRLGVPRPVTGRFNHPIIGQRPEGLTARKPCGH